MPQQISRDDEAGRRSVIAEALAACGLLTITEAWEYGHRLGFYKGGDGGVTKDDLNAVGRRHDGFWRYRSNDPRRESARRWSDYWTPRAAAMTGDET